MRVSRTALLAISGWLTAAALAARSLLISNAPSIPRNATETLNHVLGCAREREPGFRENDYDIEILQVDREGDRAYEVWFKPKGGSLSPACTFGYRMMDRYCLALTIAARP